MKKDKRGHIHDSAGRFAPKPTYVKIRFIDKLDIAAYLFLFIGVANLFEKYTWPNAVDTFKALAALWQ